MAAKSSIEWTDATWSPLRVRVRRDAAAIAQAKGFTSLVQIAAKTAGQPGHHCEHVSAECDHCYSESWQARCLNVNGTGLPFDRRSRDLVEPFVDERMVLEPLRWKKPRRIFVESQSDLFGEWFTDEMIDRVFAVMALCPQHTFQVLTKRAARMREYLQDRTRSAGIDVRIYKHMRFGRLEPRNPLPNWPLANVWLGVSAGTQKAADERIPELLRTPAAVRFVSAEPLLEAVTLPTCNGRANCTLEGIEGHSEKPFGGIHWVICGGESGAGARPMHPHWARKLRNDSNAAGVSFFFKQWGEWAPYGGDVCNGFQGVDAMKWEHFQSPFYADRNTSSGEPSRGNVVRRNAETMLIDRQEMVRMGKHKAGRLLDGVEHNALPAYWPANVGLADPKREGADLAVIS